MSNLAYPWNKSREAIGRDRPLTRAELRQVQGVLNRIDRLPFFLQTLLPRVITSSAAQRALWVGCISSKTRLSASYCRVLSVLMSCAG